MMDKKSNNGQVAEMKQPLIILAVYILLAVITPIILKYAVFENAQYSLLSNDGWASFLGSYVGGALGGGGTLLAMYLTLKNTIELQQKSKENADNQMEINNLNHNKEYQRDKADRDKERKEDSEKREQEIRRAFADDIAQLLGVYIAHISSYYYAVAFSHML